MHYAGRAHKPHRLLPTGWAYHHNRNMTINLPSPACVLLGHAGRATYHHSRNMSTSLPCMCIAWLCDFSCLSSTCRSPALCAHSNLLYACAILHHDILLSPAHSWVCILTELPSNIHASTCMVKPHVIVFGRDHDAQQRSAAYVRTKFREALEAPTHCWQKPGLLATLFLIPLPMSCSSFPSSSPS